MESENLKLISIAGKLRREKSRLAKEEAEIKAKSDAILEQESRIA
jgi:hypothetical protein